MDDLIHALLQVDKQARQRVSRAKKQRAGALEALELEKKEIRAKNEEAFEAFVAQQTERIHAARDEQIRQINAQFDKVDAALDETYREHADDWVSQIVSAVTKA